MSLPKVFTLEASPGKSTLAFDVLEPSKLVMESQINTNYNLTRPSMIMKITAEPAEGAALPSLVYDASSSGIPSEDSRATESSDDETASSGRTQSDHADDGLNFRMDGRHRHHHRHERRGRVASSSKSEDDEDSTTRKSGPPIKRTAAFTGRKSRGKGVRIAQDKSEGTSPTADTDDSVYKYGDWTGSQVALLMSMKEGGETWAAIATALGREKSDVQRFFKNFKSSSKGKSWAKGSNTRRSRRHRKSTPSLLSSSSDSEPADISPPSPTSSESDLQQQMYLEEQIRENLYPPYLSLQEDNHFTKRDCAVLATVDSKMKRGKWLEMQANFFNATGKMVPISVFRDKCEAAEADERDRIREAKIKAWKAGLDGSEQLDPDEPGRFEQYA